MNIKLMILDKIVNWLLGGDLFEFIKSSVELINNAELTGEQKRAQVYKEAKEVFGDAVSVLVNLGIEVAVLLLKNQIGEVDAN